MPLKPMLSSQHDYTSRQFVPRIKYISRQVKYVLLFHKVAIISSLIFIFQNLQNLDISGN